MYREKVMTQPVTINGIYVVDLSRVETNFRAEKEGKYF